MKIIYSDCFSGISGDMILGALLDAGLPFKQLKRELTGLPFHNYHLSAQKVTKQGMAATKVSVMTKSTKSLSLREMVSLIRRSRLANTIKQDSIKILERLGKVEAKVHGIKQRTKIHLHELGSPDTLIDIVGAVTGLSLLEIRKIYVSALPLNYGLTKTRHGIIPIPAPATAELIKGFLTYPSPIAEELVTPTGAAIVSTLGQPCHELPLMRVSNVGYGAGEKELPQQANLLRVIIGESILSRDQTARLLSGSLKDTESVWMIETNLDDISPEIMGYLFEKLFEEGALDVSVIPIQMKKSRPGMLLQVLSKSETVESLESIIFSETTTFGIRKYPVQRLTLEREEILINTRYGKVKVKIGRFEGKIKSISPEYEDCRRLARTKAVPLKKIYEEVKRKIIK